MARSICSSYFTATLPYRPGAATTLPLCKESAHFISKNREVILSPILSDHEVLMSFTGAGEVKRAEDGLPTPILLRLHRGSTFVDTTYLARQAFTFSCHSWRSFFPAPMPITVMYSQLIARLLGNF